MPNWCVGNLKVRGNKENIIDFLTEGFTPVGYIFGTTSAVATIEQDDWSFTRKLPDGHWAFHLNNSRRNFVEGNLRVEFYNEEIEIVVLENFRGAWSLDVEALALASKQFGIDLKIYAFERGMSFNLDIEIHKGEVIKADEIKFSDYRWECIDPEMGG